MGAHRAAVHLTAPSPRSTLPPVLWDRAASATMQRCSAPSASVRRKPGWKSVRRLQSRSCA
eukprot:10949497-Lingulodinium_polyedra.AAC.1